MQTTFAIAYGAGLAYRLTAPAVSRWLSLAKPGQSTPLIAGTGSLARRIAEAIGREGYEVVLVDSNPSKVSAARLAGLTLLYDDAMLREVAHTIALSSIGR